MTDFKLTWCQFIHHIRRFSHQNAKLIVLAHTKEKISTPNLKNSRDVSAPSARFFQLWVLQKGDIFVEVLSYLKLVFKFWLINLAYLTHVLIKIRHSRDIHILLLVYLLFWSQTMQTLQWSDKKMKIHSDLIKYIQYFLDSNSVLFTDVATFI